MKDLKKQLNKGIELKSVSPVIFDDSELCRTYNGECDFIKTIEPFGRYCCPLFGNAILKEIVYFIEKCDDCKDALLEMERL